MLWVLSILEVKTSGPEQNNQVALIRLEGR